MKKEKTKSNKSVGKIIVMILALTMLAGAVMTGFAYCNKNAAEGKFNIFGKDLNENNLIKRENYHDALLQNADCGINMKWKDDGHIVLSGKVKAEDEAPINEYFKHHFTTLELAPGIYTLSTGNDNVKKDSYGIYYEYFDNNAIRCTGYVSSKEAVLDLSQAGPCTMLKLYVFVKSDVRLMGWQSKIYPTLVEGQEPGQFYK